MKIRYISSFLGALLILMIGCSNIHQNVMNNPTGSPTKGPYVPNQIQTPIQTIDDIVISDSFYWRTTTKVQVEIFASENKLVKVYYEDYEGVLQECLMNITKANGTLTYYLSIPTYVKSMVFHSAGQTYEEFIDDGLVRCTIK